MAIRNTYSGLGGGSRDPFYASEWEKKNAALEAEKAATPNDATNNAVRDKEISKNNNTLNIKRLANFMSPVLLGGAMGQVPVDTMMGVLTGGLLGVMAPKWFSGKTPKRQDNQTPQAQTEAAPASVTPEGETPPMPDDTLTTALQRYAQENGIDPGASLADPMQAADNEFLRKLQEQGYTPAANKQWGYQPNGQWPSAIRRQW